MSKGNSGRGGGIVETLGSDPNMSIGYRYGDIPSNERSWNTREGKFESGISMASVASLPETQSIAVLDYKSRKAKKYLIGTVVKNNKGGDDEFLFKNARYITRSEYKKALRSIPVLRKKAELSTRIYKDTKYLVDRGYNLGDVLGKRKRQSEAAIKQYNIARKNRTVHSQKKSNEQLERVK